jgi:hypothetical protein
MRHLSERDQRIALNALRNIVKGERYEPAEVRALVFDALDSFELMVIGDQFELLRMMQANLKPPPRRSRRRRKKARR